VYQKVIDAHFGDAALKRLQRRLGIMAYLLLQQKNEEAAKQALAAALAFDDTPKAMLKTHPFLKRLILDSIQVTQDVLEDGYIPEEIEKDKYLIRRNEQGELTVQFLEENK
jgi:hypothetical protein